MIVILEGESGSGKTSACANLARLATASGRLVRGLVCPGRFEAGRKLGIDALDLESGESWLLAHAVFDIGDKPTAGSAPKFDDSRSSVIRYGRWEFTRTGLARADAAAARGFRGPGPAGPVIIIVDEIGPLELDHGVGMTRTLAGIDAEAGRGVMAIVVTARPNIADALARRWPRTTRLGIGKKTGQTYTDAEETALATMRALSLQ